MKKILFTLLAFVDLFCFAQDIEPSDSNIPDGSIGGYDYIDLGLPSGTLWAVYNIGANSPYEYGDYFGWGEVTPKSSYTWENYSFAVSSVYDPNKGDSYDLEDIGDNICGTEYDAARHIWGHAWRLPNERERNELFKYCWHKWTTENGINGTRIYGRNGRSIFLPAAGYQFYTDYPFYNIWGYYWTGELYPVTGFYCLPIEPSNRAHAMTVDLSGLQFANCARSGGNSIRPVINKKEAGIETVTSNDLIDIYCKDECIIIKGIKKGYSIAIADMTGRQIISETDYIYGEFSSSPISKGIYLVVVSNGLFQVKTQKVILN